MPSSTTSHVRQLPPGTIQDTLPTNDPRDYDTWQMFDPPSKIRSLNTPVAYRDCELVAIMAEATKAGTTDTTFEVLIGEPDDNGDLVFVDVLDGNGILEAHKTSDIWTPDPPTVIRKGTTRRAINLTGVGGGLRGLAVVYLYR
jgi:hypothetical protein